MEPEKPWLKYLIPNVKSERLKFYNSTTEDIYESAFIGKQFTFQAYLEGQRKFRWDIKTKLARIEKIQQSYLDGIIPKENIDSKRYQSFPSDIKIEDIGKCKRVLVHMNNSLSTIKEHNEHLLNSKKELFDENMKVRSWSSNELAFIDKQIDKLATFIKATKRCYMISKLYILRWLKGLIQLR